ncbi:alternative ribosome rescue aminoacyl-tRNA hydrolase ArfB [Roseimarinus sediminis]|uniref:alternative ribosome rescue aminoacyl-tRNA hydrolase ArfB n=1 Tax=Roseimarinus sediminis TaxID=1610899 RepID=UPI003D244F4B
MNIKLKSRNFETEFSYKTSRSSGPGGQNVNKLNTRVELRFDVTGSMLLSENEKKKIKSKLGNRINSNGELLITSQSERSQLKNKQAATERFYQLLTLALQPVKKRKATRPTRSSVEKRLDKKRLISEKKSLRRKDF